MTRKLPTEPCKYQIWLKCAPFDPDKQPKVEEVVSMISQGSTMFTLKIPLKVSHLHFLEGKCFLILLRASSCERVINITQPVIELCKFPEECEVHRVGSDLTKLKFVKINHFNFVQRTLFFSLTCVAHACAFLRVKLLMKYISSTKKQLEVVRSCGKLFAKWQKNS